MIVDDSKRKIEERALVVVRGKDGSKEELQVKCIDWYIDRLGNICIFDGEDVNIIPLSNNVLCVSVPWAYENRFSYNEQSRKYCTEDDINKLKK